MKIEVHNYHHADNDVERRLARILDHLNILNSKLEAIMATLDQVLQDVTDESTAIDSISTLIDGLKQQIADALSGATLPPAVQSKVDAIFAQAETNKAKIAAALSANVPPTP